MKSTKAFGYLRVSTKAQAKENRHGFNRQREAIELAVISNPWLKTQQHLFKDGFSHFEFVISDGWKQRGINNTTDIVNLIQQVQDEIGKNIFVSSYGFDANSRIFLVGYRALTDNSTLEGGVIIITEDGNLIDLIELPFVPTYFVETQFF